MHKEQEDAIFSNGKRERMPGKQVIKYTPSSLSSLGSQAVSGRWVRSNRKENLRAQSCIVQYFLIFKKNLRSGNSEKD